MADITPPRRRGPRKVPDGRAYCAPAHAGMAQQDYLWAPKGLDGRDAGVLAGAALGVTTVTGIPKPNSSVAEVTWVTALAGPWARKESTATKRRSRPWASR